VDWSPDSRFLSFSRGPASKGDPDKTGTFQAACEIVGVYAPGWDLCAVFSRTRWSYDLNRSTNTDCLMLTTNGATIRNRLVSGEKVNLSESAMSKGARTFSARSNVRAGCAFAKNGTVRNSHMGSAASAIFS